MDFPDVPLWFLSRYIGFLIPLFNTGPESHELPRIDKYLDSCLNRTQFMKILTDSHSSQSVLAIRRSIGNSGQKF